MPDLPRDITPYFTGDGGGIALLAVAVGCIVVLAMWAWMLYDALRAGMYFWAAFILLVPLLGWLLYYFTVYRKVLAGKSAFYRFFRLFSWFVVLPFLCVAVPAAWLVLDGLHDNFDHADVALVPGYGESSPGDLGPALTARLDRTIVLYQENKFPFIIVSGQDTAAEKHEPERMAHYLESRQIPASVIILDHRSEKAGDTVDNLSRIMKGQGFHSVMVISDYYRLTRLKVYALRGGVREVEQAHVGQWNRGDIPSILGEVVTTYDRLAKMYLLPVAQRIYGDVLNTKDTISEDVSGSKDTINRSLDGMSK